ncbi:cytochrome c5 family protein [Idiomarina loihiensis]|uniref:Cytochrome c5 n=1 Tax=Idiomarina loihiensis (strain ATCC BAA-735 / DSM 15497 / L2-TR) TaxID=283942 RepID=Q5QZ81_IDILO|nr:MULTISPECIES: cytochrome c5 family protein [Idiomarina]MAA61456.1 cytochrome c5 family protein [Idiomarina sp.]AAV81048.1 Cytochrome c5 [Idiomarina loihiensis L2TR]AGM35072.1 cytochrome c5 [Idiomarina loihiensis GSL 199]MBL4855857.1 cytochrome c5 family protein [Idiomarina sp.]PHQ92923.1 MAG: cytochrome c5 family protein [Idiomarina sp.]
MKAMNSFFVKSVLGTISMLFALSISAASVQDDMSREAIAERIKPLGKHYVAGESSAAEESSGPRSGQQVYDKYCTACHTSGVMGAPKRNNAADWQPRLDQGMETVLKHAVEGFNAMPPKGTCSDCSEEEIQAAINYMTEEI